MARIPDDLKDAEFVRRLQDHTITSSEPGRHRSRQHAMMLLYQHDLMSGDVDPLIASFSEDHGSEMSEYGREIVRGVVADLAAIDAAIEEHLEGWDLSRLGAVERTILRIAIFELRGDDVPNPVASDEAVELTKRYASPEAAKLVNGILGGWIRATGGTE